MATQEVIQVGTRGIAILCKNVRKIERAIDKKCMSGQARQSELAERMETNFIQYL